MSDHETVVHAVNLMDQAVTQLVGPRQDWIGGRYVTRASRYTELAESSRVHADGRSHHSGSMPTIWVDAVDWLREVDSIVSGWAADGTTPQRLQAVTEAHWRPDDLLLLAGYTKYLLNWRARADELLDPPRRMEIAAECPECEKSVVYHFDALGERVRQPALSVTTESCECLNCHASWPKERFVFLARVIGCKQVTSDTA